MFDRAAMTLAESSLRLDPAMLQRWLAVHLPNAPPPFEICATVGRQPQRLTRVDDARGGHHVLVRRSNRVPASGVHGLAREYHLQHALRCSAVPVPVVHALCEDARVIGAPFYVRQWVEGDGVVSTHELACHLPDGASRHAVPQEIIRTLAAIHRLDVDAAGLDNLGIRTDFVARQIERTRSLWEQVRNRDVPLIDAVHAQLVRRKPPQRYTGLVHNDYRLGNLVISSLGRVNAVLDWEYAALGDVLVDIGVWLNDCDETLDVPGRKELVALYVQETGFDVAELNFYRALAYWRSAIIGQGLKRRYEAGEIAATSGSLATLDHLVEHRAELADRFLPA